MLLASTERSLEALRYFVEATMQTYSHEQAQVKHLGLRTCEWAQRLKPLPTTRTRKLRTDMRDIELHQCRTGRCCEPSNTKRHTSETTKVSCCPPASALLTAADFWSFKLMSVCFPLMNPLFTASYFWNLKVMSFGFPVWAFVLTASDFWCFRIMSFCFASLSRL